MEISVIMSVYKENFHEISQSVSSILNQTYKDFEFIIIDNNPNSLKLRSFLNHERERDSRIRIVINDYNYGASYASNEAIKLAKGKYIARMDADDICDKDRLIYQLNFIKLYDLDMVCSNFRGFNNFRIARPYYGNKDLINQNKIKNILRYCNFAIGPTMFFKKQSLIKVGGYRNILCEDYDLVCRFIVNRCKIGYQSNILLYKRNRRNNISNRNSICEFVVSHMIKKCIKRYNYNRVVPLENIRINIRNLTKYDIDRFRIFQYRFMKFKNKKSIINIIKLVGNIMSSRLLLENVFSLLINKLNKNKV